MVLLGNATKLGDKEANQYTTNDRFAILIGTIPTAETGTGNNASVLFPAGFNKENCTIISVMLHNTSNTTGVYGTGTTFSSGSYASGCLPCRAYMNDNGIVIETKNITIYDNEAPRINSSNAIDFKLVLMRID